MLQRFISFGFIVFVLGIFVILGSNLYGNDEFPVNSKAGTSGIHHGVGPFMPQELGGHSLLPADESPECKACGCKGVENQTRLRALRDIKIQCGRCHLWAEDSHLILREKAKIKAMIHMGHGLNGLSQKRQTFLLSAFNKQSDHECRKEENSQTKTEKTGDEYSE